MVAGNWRQAQVQVLAIPAWEILELTYPGIRHLVAAIVKEESLRVFLLQAPKLYDSISLKYLNGMLDLPVDGSDHSVRAFIGRMIQSGDLTGAFDATDQYFIFAQAAPSRTQRVCVQLSSKTTKAFESLERLWGTKSALSNPARWRLSDATRRPGPPFGRGRGFAGGSRDWSNDHPPRFRGPS
jgi:hypothetical protein